MFRELLKRLKWRAESSRKWRKTQRFMNGRAMIHALADSGALALPVKS